MYCAKNVYQTHLTYYQTGKSEDEFFKACIQKAIAIEPQLQDVDPEYAKKNLTPVCYFSYLTSESPALLERKGLDWKRARRLFIFFDVDYEEDEIEESNQQKSRFIAFAQRMKTKCFIYPTISFPMKPRYRVVFFPKSPLTYMTYQKAVRWVANECDYQLTDDFDFNMKMNKNLPLFINHFQSENVIMIDEGVPLDNKLWANEKAVLRQAKPFDKTLLDASKDVVLTLSDERHIALFHELAHDECNASYQTMWRIIEALAQAVLVGGMSYECAMQCAAILSEYSQDEFTRRKWAAGNQQLLQKSLAYLSADPERLKFVKPLASFGPYLDSLQTIFQEKKGNEK